MIRAVPASILFLLACWVSAGRTEAREGFLGPDYPIDAEVSYTAGLFHWVDSLANTSAGKTIPAHRLEFARRWGGPTRGENELLRRFRSARLAHGTATRNVSSMLGIFCEAPNVSAAVAAAGKDLTPEEADDLAKALAGLAPKFDAMWNDGSVPRAFLKRAARDGRRGDLAALLARIAAFYDVDVRTMPRPRLVLVPVPDGFGTHAQAVGRSLLLEVRPGDDLAQQAAVMVHENAHFLFHTMPEERRAQLADEAKSFHAAGENAWRLLEEALPTALGQGIADQAFRPKEWSPRGTWYHTENVNVYAKALHAAANHALATGGLFDERFVRHAVLIWGEGSRRRGPQILGMEAPAPAPAPAPGAEREPTPR